MSAGARVPGRIYEDHAYGTAALARCWWPETCEIAPQPALQGGARSEVAVIGAGYTGLSAALHLAEEGREVTVLEAQQPGWGASGRNGGFCCIGGAMAGSDDIARRFGPDAAGEWRAAQGAAVQLVAALIARHGIDADTHSNGEIELAHSPRMAERWQKAGAEVIPAADLPAMGLNGPFHGARHSPEGFALNPRKYLAGLLSACLAAGVRIHGASPVTSIAADAGGHVLTTPQGQLTARQLIVATNGYSSDRVPPWMAGRYMPAVSHIIVTRPLSAAERAAQGWTSQQMCYDSRRLLHYFRLMPDGRFLFGRRGGVAAGPGAEARAARATRRDFEAMFPAWRGVETPWSWQGLVCLTRAGLPYAGPLPGMPSAWAGFGWHGNGVAMGSYAGQLLAGLAMGRPLGQGSVPRAMSAPPARIPLGRWRRLLLRPAYAALGLRDRLG